MKKKLLIAGNWKMNLTLKGSSELLQSISDALAPSVVQSLHPLQDTDGQLFHRGLSALIAPSLLALSAVQNLALNALPNMAVAAQDVHFENEGAFTGRISASMLAGSGIKTCLVGHSETRRYFHETDISVQKKVAQLQNNGILPIICVGETLEERENGMVEAVLVKQIKTAVERADLSRIVVAYEPVWAIGTGRSASGQQADEAHAILRNTLAEILQAAKNTFILYGGSVNIENAENLLKMPNIDGTLIGGASLKPQQFADIIAVAKTLIE